MAYIYLYVFVGDLETAVLSILFPAALVVDGPVVLVIAVLAVFVPVYPTFTFSFVDYAKPDDAKPKHL